MQKIRWNKKIKKKIVNPDTLMLEQVDKEMVYAMHRKGGTHSDKSDRQKKKAGKKAEN